MRIAALALPAAAVAAAQPGMVRASPPGFSPAECWPYGSRPASESGEPILNLKRLCLYDFRQTVHIPGRCVRGSAHSSSLPERSCPSVRCAGQADQRALFGSLGSASAWPDTIFRTRLYG